MSYFIKLYIINFIVFKQCLIAENNFLPEDQQFMLTEDLCLNIDILFEILEGK